MNTLRGRSHHGANRQADSLWVLRGGQHDAVGKYGERSAVRGDREATPEDANTSECAGGGIEHRTLPRALKLNRWAVATVVDPSQAPSYTAGIEI